MSKRLMNQTQRMFRWEADDATWNAVPKTQQSLCRKLVSQLLQAIIAAEKAEGRENDEREDQEYAS